MKPRAKTIARGLPRRVVSQHRPFLKAPGGLTVKSHESGLFRGLLTHSYIFFKCISRKRRFEPLPGEIDEGGKKKNAKRPGIVIITRRMSRERADTLDGGVSYFALGAR